MLRSDHSALAIPQSEIRNSKSQISNLKSDLRRERLEDGGDVRQIAGRFVDHGAFVAEFTKRIKLMQVWEKYCTSPPRSKGDVVAMHKTVG